MTERHTEVKFTGDGVSVTVYENAEVIDEYWRTWAEVEELKGAEHIAMLG